MYFIDRGSYISNNNNSHCFDSISQLPGKRGLQRAPLPRAQEGVGGAGGTLGAGREPQAGRSQLSRHRDWSTAAATSTPQPYSHLTTDLPLTQRLPGAAESSLGLSQAGMSPVLCPGQCQCLPPCSWRGCLGSVRPHQGCSSLPLLLQPH